MREIAPGVHVVEGLVNRVLVADDRGILAIDAGLPGDWEPFVAGLDELGGRDRLQAVLLTHGHVDHAGVAELARRDLGVRVLAGEHETGLMKRPLLGSPTERLPLRYTGPDARRSLVALIRGGAFRPHKIQAWQPVVDDEVLEDLPGAPRIVATPGHTKGHVSVLLPGAGVLVAGDALVTWDPYTGHRGPCPVALGATYDRQAARASLEKLAGVDGVPLLVPGHGDIWDGGVAEAARIALDVPHR